MTKSQVDGPPAKNDCFSSVRSSVTIKLPSSNLNYQSNLRGSSISLQDAVSSPINDTNYTINSNETQGYVEDDNHEHKGYGYRSIQNFGFNNASHAADVKIAGSTKVPLVRGSRISSLSIPASFFSERSPMNTCVASVIHEDHSSFDGSMDSKDSDRDFTDESATFPNYYFEDEKNNNLVEPAALVSSGVDLALYPDSVAKQNSDAPDGHFDQYAEISAVENLKYPRSQGVSVSSWTPVFHSDFSNNWDLISELENIGTSGDLGEARGLLNHARSSSLTGSDSLSEGSRSMGPPILQTKGHSRVPSVSSIYSANSNRPISLGALKRTFSLRPGEGISSNYVETIRKYAGTSYNEAGPGIWKLPAGIVPIDKREMVSQGNRKFIRGISGLGIRPSKSSGVELKHGHLQPRLLAAEVDEGDLTNKFGALGRSNTFQNKALTPVTSKSSTPSTGLNGVSRTSSLERVSTLASISTTGDLQSSSSKISASRRGSSTSLAESVGSVHQIDNMDIYYQHRGYKIEMEENNMTENNFKTDSSYNANECDRIEDNEPRLFLVNPDSD